MTYEIAKRILLAFLALYALMGISAHIMSAKSNSTEDLYPFFSWFLFVNVPSRAQADFEIEIVEVDNQAISPPASLENLPDVFMENNLSDRELRDLIEKLGRAVENKNTGVIILTRQKLEMHFRKKVSYNMLKLHFNPIDRLRTGKIDKKTVLASFVSNLP